jgi:hypothetical protein
MSMQPNENFARKPRVPTYQQKCAVKQPRWRGIGDDVHGLIADVNEAMDLTRGTAITPDMVSHWRRVDSELVGSVIVKLVVALAFPDDPAALASKEQLKAFDETVRKTIVGHENNINGAFGVTSAVRSMMMFMGKYDDDNIDSFRCAYAAGPLGVWELLVDLIDKAAPEPLPPRKASAGPPRALSLKRNAAGNRLAAKASKVRDGTLERFVYFIMGFERMSVLDDEDAHPVRLALCAVRLYCDAAAAEGVRLFPDLHSTVIGAYVCGVTGKGDMPPLAPRRISVPADAEQAMTAKRPVIPPHILSLKSRKRPAESDPPARRNARRNVARGAAGGAAGPEAVSDAALVGAVHALLALANAAEPLS